MPKIESFERHTDAYDEWFERNIEVYQAELKAIEQLMPTKIVQAMEVGVGSGKFAVPLGIKIGVEPSLNMAKKAKEQGVEVYQGIAESLPFSDATFDLILMVTTICFVDDVVQSFDEISRVLKKNGQFIVGFVDKTSQLGRQYEQKRNTSKFYKEATFFSTQEILDYLEERFVTTDIRQTLIANETTTTVNEGFGEGAFVAILSHKK